jgi:hypothetical protein
MEFHLVEKVNVVKKSQLDLLFLEFLGDQVAFNEFLNLHTSFIPAMVGDTISKLSFPVDSPLGLQLGGTFILLHPNVEAEFS